MRFRLLLALLAAALAGAACTKTADTAATSTSAGADVAPRPAAAQSPYLEPEVMKLARPRGGEWMGLFLQGKKAGWAFSDVKETVFDGQRAVEAISDVTLSATIGGAKTVRHMHEAHFYAFKDGSPLIGIEVDKTGDGGEEHIRGVQKNGQLVLTITRPGRAVETRTLPASAETIDQADAPRLALARHATVAGKAFDTDSFADKSVVTTVETPSTVVASGVSIPVQRTVTLDDKDKMPTTLTYDAKGRAVDARFGEPPVMVGQAEDEASAKKLDTVDLFALTRVVLDAAPGKSAFGDTPTLTLHVKGLPPKFQKDPARQTYAPGPGGTTQVTISGHGPTKRMTLPIAGRTPEVEDALKSDEQVEANDPAIAAQARAIVGHEKDAWTAAKALSAWVHATVTDAYGESSDRASDVLRRKTGDCTEHALLFTALARAAGIPARRVDGLVYMGVTGQPPAMYWHEWAEVWIGGWVAIDPTFGEPVADATHLALGEEGHADSAALIGQLAITVVP